MNKNKVSLVISAPSGTGKTTIITRLLADSDLYSFSVSTTTRNMRDGEVNGKNYYFVSIDTFNRMIKKSEFAEWATVHKNFYGTQKTEVDRIINEGKIPIFDIDVQGAIRLKEVLINGVFIFILPPNMEELEKRLRLRHTDTEEQIKVRLKNAVEEMKSKELFDFILVNEKVDDVVEKIASIIDSKLKA